MGCLLYSFWVHQNILLWFFILLCCSPSNEVSYLFASKDEKAGIHCEGRTIEETWKLKKKKFLFILRWYKKMFISLSHWSILNPIILLKFLFKCWLKLTCMPSNRLEFLGLLSLSVITLTHSGVRCLLFTFFAFD